MSTTAHPQPPAQEDSLHEKYAEDTKRSKSLWKEIKRKLITNEDRAYGHTHKILGGVVLVSFIYRYLLFYPLHGTLGIDGSMFSWLTMAVHLALSCSSLIFHVLSRRLLKRPMIIWQEYRLHAIVFSLRSFHLFVFGMIRPFSPENGWNPNVEYAALFAVIMAHHLMADEITRRFGSSSHTTVRVNDSFNLTVTIILRYYAFYQIVGLASYLIPNSQMGDLGFNGLIAIQSSAFLMTLYRKNLIVERTHGICYTIALVISMFHMFRILGVGVFLLKATIVYVMRTQFRVNKYVCWASFSLASSPWFETKVASEMSTFLHLYQSVIPGEFYNVSYWNILVLLYPLYCIVRGYYARMEEHSTASKSSRSTPCD